jgi:hypothetical protein
LSSSFAFSRVRRRRKLAPKASLFSDRPGTEPAGKRSGMPRFSRTNDTRRELFLLPWARGPDFGRQDVSGGAGASQSGLDQHVCASLIANRWRKHGLCGLAACKSGQRVADQHMILPLSATLPLGGYACSAPNKVACSSLRLLSLPTPATVPSAHRCSMRKLGHLAFSATTHQASFRDLQSTPSRWRRPRFAASRSVVVDSSKPSRDQAFFSQRPVSLCCQ